MKQYYEKYELCFKHNESEVVDKNKYTIYGYCDSTSNLNVLVDGLAPETDDTKVWFSGSFENTLRNMASIIFNSDTFYNQSISLRPYDCNLIEEMSGINRVMREK